MKKTFLLTIFGLLLSSTACLAQSNKLTSYSVYDVNHDTKVAVSDATAVVDRAKKTLANDQQVVDAAALNEVLKSIEASLASLSSRLAAIEEKLGINNPSTDPYNGHEYVDLGLPSGLKWATMNVGATTPEDYGQYFAWGETEPKSTYDWSTYKWCSNGDWTRMTKYTYDDGQTSCIWYNNGTFVGDNKTILDPEDDAAHVNWGGEWRMPTKAEQDELTNKNNCTWTWTTQKGVNGYKVMSKKNGNSIFLPAAGYRYDSTLDDVGSWGAYWSSSLSFFKGDSSGIANHFDLLSDEVLYGRNYRYYGFSVRACCP